MRPFSYYRATDADDAVRAAAGTAQAAYIAGGTDLLNLMKDGVESPGLLVDVSAIPPGGVRSTTAGIRICAFARLRDVADDEVVAEHYPLIASALLQGASGQVRNMATIGGNLLQRTRCWYFRDPGSACNKRREGAGCPALRGENRWHAILGGSESCIAVHPSDLAVALLALDATILTQAPDGGRRIGIDDFYRFPGDTPSVETNLAPGELIVAVEVPSSRCAVNARYVKARDRASFEFALVSAAVGLDIGDGIVRDARIALGGVAPRPWRARAAEDALRGSTLGPGTIRAVAAAAVHDASPRSSSGFKTELVQGCITVALRELS